MNSVFHLVLQFIVSARNNPIISIVLGCKIRAILPPVDPMRIPTICQPFTGIINDHD